MKRNSWIVEDHGIRPRGAPDSCFYCSAIKGSEHNPGCVIRSRTVVIRVSIDLVTIVPEDWTKENIEFQYNESSWCANNIVDNLNDLLNRTGDNEDDGTCLCDSFTAEFVRGATEEDEINQKLFCQTLPS